MGVANAPAKDGFREKRMNHYGTANLLFWNSSFQREDEEIFRKWGVTD